MTSRDWERLANDDDVIVIMNETMVANDPTWSSVENEDDKFRGE